MNYSLDDYAQFSNTNSSSTSSDSNRVEFFTLKEGEEAIVRFMHDSRNDFQVTTMHEVQINGNTRRVACIADAHNPNVVCPLCHSARSFVDRFGNTIEVKNQVTRVYIKILRYVRDTNGNIIAVPQVWDRPVKSRNGADAMELCGYIDNYGPLSDMICKISRRGNKLDTRYSISPNLSKAVYRDDVYVKDTTAFDGFSILGRVVLDRTADEMNEFERVGIFPMRGRDNASTSSTLTSANFASQNSYTATSNINNNPFNPNPEPLPTTPFNQSMEATWTSPNGMYNTPPTNNVNWGTQSTSDVQRPVRIY